MVPLDELESTHRVAWVRRALILVPALAFIALLTFGLFQAESADLTAGERAPDFELPLLDRAGVLSSQDLQGKPVVLNFWASWCIPCREEAPLLERAWREYRDDGVVFVGVNIKDSASDATDFVERFDITYPVVRDEEEDLARKLGVYGLPETFFIDHEWSFMSSVSGGEQGERQDTVVLGAISEDQLVTNLDLLVRRAAGSSGASSEVD